ncbi:MAG TPA: fructosamine kinase family protein [Kineosporiaceae bacterium]|nr:fructosamine kinase family protein [Kineosporiaceae bacterium]
MTFVKADPHAPPGFFEVEAAGLAWLADAESSGGARVVRVHEVAPGRLELDRVAPGRPTRPAAAAFGAALAATHRAGAPWFGCPPVGWEGPGYIGAAPLSYPPAPLPWGAFFARHRIEPYLRAARDAGSVDAAGARRIEAVCARLEAGDADLAGDPEEPAARLHGDLWSGNVLWSPDGAVLVDPAAHGGHRESDLAMLALFGLPDLGAVLDAYDAAWPLAPGWRDRVGLHQLFPLLVHAVLFGSGYGAQAVAVARRYA